MRTRYLMRLCSVAAVFAVATPLATTARAQGASTPERVPTNCNRDCLESLIDDYLAAVIAHDPSDLPLSQEVLYTENKKLVELGEGFWNTATARGNYNHYFADPEMAQAGWMGTMREGDTLLLMALRLRVQLGRITEIETSYFRPGGGGPNDIQAMEEMRTPEALWLEPIPENERMTRNELIEIANAYFAGVENNDGMGFYPFTDDCDRIENGAHTTNSPGSPTPGGFDYSGEDCKGQLESGYLAIVTEIHNRRFPLVDVERGVVFAYCIFDMGGTVSEITLATTGETISMAMFAGRASSIDVTEAFRIENGLIRRVEMIGGTAPFHIQPDWPGGISGH